MEKLAVFRRINVMIVEKNSVIAEELKTRPLNSYGKIIYLANRFLGSWIMIKEQLESCLMGTMFQKKFIILDQLT